MNQTRYQRMKQAIKRVVAKPVVAGFAAFTLLTATPMLAPKRARAIDTVVCKEYGQDKIVNRYLNLPDKKMNDEAKLKTLSALDCLERKRGLQGSKQLFEVLLLFTKEKNDRISLCALDLMKRMNLPKSQMNSIRGYTMQLLDSILHKAGTESASKSIMLVFDYAKKYNLIFPRSSFKSNGQLKNRTIKNMAILRASMLLYFGAQKDARKAAKELIALLNDKDREVKKTAAHSLYAYIVGYSPTDKMKLDKNIKSKVENLLSKRKKEIYGLMYGRGRITEFENYLGITIFLFKEQDRLVRNLIQRQQYYILKFSYRYPLRLSDRQLRAIMRGIKKGK